MTIEITTEELQEELEGIKTCQPVSISYEGEVKMNKTGNPFHGEIVKSCTINGLIGFVYRNAVNNQLGREDKELDFVPHNRTWGERRGTLVYHKGKVYVEIKAQSNSTPVYKYKDGTGGEPTREVRETLLNRIRRGDLSNAYGVDVQLSDPLADRCLHDEHGDVLDSVLCAIQAAWAFGQRSHGWGVPADVDLLEGWIVDPSLTSGEALPSPPPRAFNSSETRVRPVFRQLLARDRTGGSWLPQLIRLATENTAYAEELARACGSIRLEKTQPRGLAAVGGGASLLEGCFERSLPPPEGFLRWCIENPRRLTRPRHSDKASAATKRNRSRLFGSDDSNRQGAIGEALELLGERGPQGSHRAWWAFEGFTSVDCCLETERLVLLIEGKRFEPPADSVSWVAGRNQVARNLEVAAAYAEESGAREYAVLVIGPTGVAGPTEGELRAGWPHLPLEEQDAILPHYLGTTTWRDVCEKTGLSYDALPITRSDLETTER